MSAAPEPVSPLLALLRRRLPFVLACGLLGALLAGGVALIRPATYRTQASLLVVEPRLAPQGTVDFNLTPIRSYVALLASPALAAACRAEVGGDVPERAKVRMPEHTRTIEVVAEGRDPKRLAAFADCIATRARAENQRLNEDLSRRSLESLAGPLESARQETLRLEAEMAELRSRSTVEVRRAELRAALADLERGADEERRLRSELAGAAARRGSYDTLSKARPDRRRFQSFLARSPEDGAARGAAAPESPVLREEADPTRDFADRESASASAAERAATATLAEARRAREAATRRASELERGITAAEEALSVLKRRLDAASSAQAELERRSALVSLESAGKAFDLVVLSPADPSPPRAGPGPALAALAGFLAAASAAALLVLSR